MYLDFIVCGALYSCWINLVDAIQVNESAIHICNSVDIGFTNLDEIYHYRDCSVIEGSVRLDSISFSKILKEVPIFPKLKEISGYIQLSRVSGLTSLRQLFPVLSVIRGNVLFHDYAFVVFEMIDLEELGLESLSLILKGGVFIAKNPALCFVDTIEWNLIARNNYKEHVYRNKVLEDCPRCPDACPKSKISYKHLCWNMNTCQKVCDCPAGCDENNMCCHHFCIGGCSGPTQNHCTSCKDVDLNGRCVESCPGPFFEFHKRRCITENECHSVSKASGHKIHMKPHDRECLHECPIGFFEKEETQGNFMCKKCENGKCSRECNPRKIISTKEDIESLKGCKYIKGPLVINLSGDYMIELEHNLNEIEIIRDYLAVKDSYHITSLNFLKNLKEIRGESRDNNYTLEVFANKNLDFLWDWEHKHYPLKINGPVYFHSNPQLCLSKIEELVSLLKKNHANESSVSIHTNGVQAVCLVTELKVNITHVKDTNISLQWSSFNYHDPRILLGYKVHYKEAVNNVTIYDERSVCGKDDWVVLDVVGGDKTETTLINLRPFTRYALFVRTSTILAGKDEQSQLLYFITEPSTPSIPRNLKLFPTNHSIYASWEPPAHPNGNITSYLVSVYSESFMFNNDSCSQENEVDLNIAKQNNNFITEESKVVEKYHIYIPGKSSKMDASEKKNYELSKTIATLFENTLMDCVFIRTSKKKRSVDSLFGVASSMVVQKNVPHLNVSLDKLQHFTPYRVVVQACQEERCGNRTSRIQVTLPHPDADKLNDSYPIISMSNRTGTVVISWEKPYLVNGFIKAYIIEYKHVDSRSSTPVCFTEQEFSKSRAFFLSSLSPGNYSIRLRSISLHGLGQFTSWKFITIPKEPLFYQYIYYIIAGVSCICVFLPLICVGMWFYIYKTGRDKLIISINPEYVTSSYIPDNWEIPRSQVELLKEIGQGSFGMVYEGTLMLDGNSPLRCAVKTVNTQASEREKMEFLNEASVMKAFDTYHVVKLLGVVSQGEPAFVVMELMTSGDLKSYLRSCRPEVVEPHVRPPTLRQLLQMSAEIADGMAYLSAKKYVHRDLAARNCMVSENLTVKIGDFGMARDVYEGDYYRKGSKGLMPVRWMAPESLREGIFLSLSDVWSYGVVLYEMVTLAAQPYQGLSNDQVLRYILDGGIIERPEDCPDRVYTLMRKCWRQKPINRPSFMDIVTYLHEDVSFSFRNVSFYDSDEGKVIRRNLQESCENQQD